MTGFPLSDTGRPGKGRSSVVARSGRRSAIILRLASLVTVLLVWEVLGRQDPLFTSYPSQILETATRTMTTEVIPAFGVTLHGFALGFAVSAPLGIVIGTAMARIRLVDLMLSPYVNALYATPRISLIPVLMLWLGIGLGLRVAIVVLSSVFPIIINTYAGAKETDSELFAVGRVFNASRWQRARTIIVPSSLPFIFTGLRLGLARALTGILTAEMAASVVGVGGLILNHGRLLRTAEMFVPMICLGILSVVFTWGLEKSQHRAMPWARDVRL